MLDNSFMFWLINFGISAGCFVAALASGNYLFAAGGLVYLAIMMVVELPGTSSEEGSAGEDAGSYDDGLS